MILAFGWVGELFVVRVVILGEVRFVGQRAFLVNRPLAEALVYVGVRQRRFALAEAEPGDVFQRLQFDDAIPQGPLQGLDEPRQGHLAAQGEQVPQEAMPLEAGRLQGVVQVGPDVRPQSPQPLFLVL